MARLNFAGTLDGLTYSGFPVSGTVSSFYGVLRPELSSGKGHSGNDVAAPIGTPVYAPMDGVVNDVFTTEETVAWRKNVAAIFGNSVFLRHNDSTGGLIGYTLYAHFNAAPSVRRSESVSVGQQIGEIGSTGQSTGPHLHWGCTVADNPYFSRSKGLNDAFKFLGEPPTGGVNEQQLALMDQVQTSMDQIDAAQSALKDAFDSAMGLVDDMEN